MKPNKKKWLRLSLVGLAIQLLLFAWVLLRGGGAPAWLEYPYLPFQAVFVRALGSYWALGIPLGLVTGTLFYSLVLGAALLLVAREKKEPIQSATDQRP